MWVWSHNSDLMRHHKSSVVKNIKLLLFCAFLARSCELQSKLLTTQQRFFFCRYDRKAWEDSAWWRRESLGTWNIINKKTPDKTFNSCHFDEIYSCWVCRSLSKCARSFVALGDGEVFAIFGKYLCDYTHHPRHSHIHSATGCVSVSLLRH